MEERFMKKRALVTGGTCKDIAAMAVFVVNIKKTNPNLVDEIVIFHDGVSEKDQKLMNSIFPCRFIRYEFPNYDPANFNDIINKYFSPMVFCKYECFRLLNEYRIVIWSDYDVVVLQDLSELLSRTDQIDAEMLIADGTFLESFTDSIETYLLEGYDLQGPGICSSLFVLFDSFEKYQECYEWCIQKARELGRYLYAGDQAVINMLLQEFNIKPYRLSGELYSSNPLHDIITDKTKILHAYKHPKFWSGLHNDAWEQNYQDWIKIGGSKLATRTFSYRLKRKLSKYFSGLKRFLKKFFFGKKYYKNLRHELKIQREEILYEFPDEEYLAWRYGDFSEKDITKDKLQKLYAGLDDTSIITINTILLRLIKVCAIIQNKFKNKRLKLDLFTKEEKEQIRLVRKNYTNNIIKISDDCYCYKQYFLPVNESGPSVLYYKHQLFLLRNIEKIKGKNIIDVGGFIGDSLLVLCPLTNKDVYSFEAASGNYQYMQKTIALNNITNAKPVRMALGSHPGTVNIAPFGSGASISNTKSSTDESVEMNTLDNVVEKYELDVGLIKVDIEGTEQDFLKGAINSIKKYKPILLISIYHTINDFFEIKPLIESWNLGYRFKISKPVDGNIVTETLLIAEVD
jgi:FkbM family methyltransferase